jgi:hypothetical protein
MLNKALNPAFLQASLLSLLFVVAPFAMSFTPHDQFCTDLSFQQDSLHRVRTTFIIGGLIATALSLALLAWELNIKSNHILQPAMVSSVVLQMSMALCSVSIGWAAIPYWVTGVFQAYRGNLPDDCYLVVFDPKRLMPMIWMGEIWRFGVIAIFVVATLMGMALFLVTIVLLMKERLWKQCVLTWGLLSIPVAILYLDSSYFVWLWD